jgi:hypothetical protein
MNSSTKSDGIAVTEQSTYQRNPRLSRIISRMRVVDRRSVRASAGAGGAARIADLDRVVSDRSNRRANAGPKRFGGKHQHEKSFEVVRARISDSRLFQASFEVLLHALLKVETDDVAAVLFARPAQQQCGGVVGFRLIDPLARGCFHAG